MLKGDTIAAIATPHGPGGVGVVRLSGPEAHKLARQFFKSDHGEPQKRKATLGWIADGERGLILDHCILTLYAAPHSYTGEDVAEFSCHGSIPVLRRLLEILIQSGARPAGGGEFTLRAVLNGKIDLAQAEAVNRLVLAKTLGQAADAVAQLEGGVSKKVKEIDSALLDVVSRMEAAVDFAEEGEEFIHRKESQRILTEIHDSLRITIRNFKQADLLRDGAVAVIAGGANVGKSTLFNALLKRQRSIVDHQPGTTRDYIAETIDLEGIPVTLVDTAGLREGGGAVEIEGMRRTEERLGEADLIVMVLECGRKPTEAEKNLLRRLEVQGKFVLQVLNKSDLCSRESSGAGAAGAIRISALLGNGISNLEGRIVESLGFNNEAYKQDKGLITEMRQQQLFRDTAEATKRATDLLNDCAYDELVLEELNTAIQTLGEITGKKTTDDILRKIFSDFCIGK